MRKHLFVVTHGVCLLFLLAGVVAVSAQNDPRQPVETSFDITLNLLSGSTDSAQKGELPSALAPIAKQLRGQFGLSNLRLADTYIGRIGNNGTINYKSLADIEGRVQPETPSFLDWSIMGLRDIAGGQKGFYIQAFRFGARVPVRVNSGVDPTGKQMSQIQYEAIGLTVERMTVSENLPVVIGTIASPKADGGRVFLVLTVSPAGN